ncbi:MAG: hypothetical protein ACK4NS_02825 [Saprospiraceae bacterium]
MRIVNTTFFFAFVWLALSCGNKADQALVQQIEEEKQKLEAPAQEMSAKAQSFSSEIQTKLKVVEQFVGSQSGLDVESMEAAQRARQVADRYEAIAKEYQKVMAELDRINAEYKAGRMSKEEAEARHAELSIFGERVERAIQRTDSVGAIVLERLSARAAEAEEALRQAPRDVQNQTSDPGAAAGTGSAMPGSGSAPAPGAPAPRASGAASGPGSLTAPPASGSGSLTAPQGGQLQSGSRPQKGN